VVAAAVAVAVAAGAFGAAALPASGYPAPPRVLRPGQHAYSSTVGRVRVRYLLYAPAAYARGRRRWPLIVFLHGSGERGTDPRQLEAQPLPETLAGTTRFPAIVFSPQLPPPYTWWSDFLAPVDALVLRLEARYRIDPRRVYLTGLSLGGFGTWSYGLRHPRRFAALVPIAGGYIQGSTAVPNDLCVLRSMPIWAFHGASDTTVYPYQSEVLVRALHRCGSKLVRFTLYPGVDHMGSWRRAYSDPALWKWLFAQRRR
jgi:predicted peptidase